jgi:hypothetical protein
LQQGLSPNVAIFSVRRSKQLSLQIPGGMSFRGTVRSDMNNPKNNGESEKLRLQISAEPPQSFERLNLGWRVSASAAHRLRRFLTLQCEATRAHGLSRQATE